MDLQGKVMKVSQLMVMQIMEKPFKGYNTAP